MEIKGFDFGHVRIDDVIYTRDVVIYPDRIETNWWRDATHLVQIKDLQSVINTLPQVLIIGTGVYNKMQIDENIRKECELKGIKLITEETSKACEIYNELKKQPLKIVTALHIT